MATSQSQIRGGGENLICRLCRGTGALFCMQARPEFYQCPACGGAGARLMHGPKVIEVKRWHVPHIGDAEK